MFNERLFRSKVVLRGLTLYELAEKIGIHETSLHSKIKRNGAFLREEIYKIANILDLSDDEIIDIFFVDALE